MNSISKDAPVNKSRLSDRHLSERYKGFKRKPETSYRVLNNLSGGDPLYLPAGRVGRFYNSVRKIIQYIHYNWKKYYLAHVTLTIADAKSTPEQIEAALNRAKTFLRTRIHRQGEEVFYAAVPEIQKKRLEKYGESVLHYHVMCFYSKAYIFPDAREIQNSWKLGNVKITAPKIRFKVNALIGYLAKYMGKGFEFEALEVKKGFTCSQIPQIYKLRPARLGEVIQKYGVYTANALKCSFTKVWREGIEGLREKKVLINWWGQSNWVNGGLVYGEPF